MITFKAFCLPVLVVVLAMTGEFVTAAPALQHKMAEAPLCDPDLIDGTFAFANLPAGEQTISLHFENKSHAACRLHGPVGPSFAVDGPSMHVALCWLCDQNDVPSLVWEALGNQILLAPDERAVLDLNWASTGESCQWADWASFSATWAKQAFYLFVPSSWPMHICSSVKSFGYRPEGNSASVAEVKEGLLRVFATPTVIYSDEYAILHVELTGAAADVSSQRGCASLYTVRHGPSIPTRFEPLGTLESLLRPSFTPEQIKKERVWPPSTIPRRCDIAIGQAIANAHIGAAELADLVRIEWRTAPGPDEVPAFLTAATHFNVLDVDTLAPNWGSMVEGIRAGLSIDRGSFRLGERVPLHLRWENVNAARPLAQGECQEPKPALEIQDSQHRVLRTNPIEEICAGHGWGPFIIQKGKPQRTFIELATGHASMAAVGYGPAWGDLPGPGVYYLVTVWSPQVFDAYDESDNTPRIVGNTGRMGKVYATARSLPVRVEVAPANNP